MIVPTDLLTFVSEALMSKVLEFFTNTSGSSLPLGTIVKSNTTANSMTSANSLFVDGVVGILGVVTSAVPNGQKGAVLGNGDGKILLEPSLTGLTPGQILWTSSSSGGRATNVKPQVINFDPVPVAILVDATGYLADGSVPVTASIQVSALGGNVTVHSTEEPFINNGGVLLQGTPVRIVTDNEFNAADASNVGAAQGTIGVLGQDAATAPAEAPIVTSGKAIVRMETGLTTPAPVGGQTIWLSPNGSFCTNIKPTTPGQALVPMGIITDGSSYGPGNPIVTATLKIPAAITAA